MERNLYWIVIWRKLFLREKNVGVVIRDERELNQICMHGEKAKAIAICGGKENVAPKVAPILTGDKFGDLVFIPRISLTPSSSEMPFEMTRRQIPIRLAYAMTINKSQGQSVNFVGIDLCTPVFSHGQLYVALSRCTSGDHTSVLLSNDASRFTTNIVYPKVLL